VSPKFRVLVLTLLTAAAVSLLVPREAAAQRGGGSGGHSGAAVARPSGGGQGGHGGPGGPGHYPAPAHYYAPRYYYPVHYYYSPFFYSPYYYYNPFFWGAWGGYGYRVGFGFGYGYPGYWQYPYPYPYYGGYYDQTGAARLQVSPKEAQVFVDGYYVGVADEFDGTMQRLRVDAGQHEVELFMEGYRTVRTPILFRRDGTVTIKTAMEPLAAGETSERPTPLGPRPGERDDPNGPEPPAGMRVYPGDRMPPPPPRASAGREDYGTLAIRVQPGDAEILIDGQHWDGSNNGSRLSVELADGQHQVEVRREGYRPYTANVRIHRGQTESLNISLTQ